MKLPAVLVACLALGALGISSATAATPSGAAHRHIVPLVHNDASGGKALVLEPFASQLGIGPNAGDPEVSALTSAGFKVDQIYDQQVTLDALKSMSNYNVVYMLSHSGTQAGQGGLIGTGMMISDPNNPPASVAPYVTNGSVQAINVSGSPTSIYFAGINETFIDQYVGQFPNDSILFIDGCDLIKATKLWDTLHRKGVGVLITWDGEPTALYNYLSGSSVFNALQQGKTVSDAVVAANAAIQQAATNLGQPAPTAKLGFVGDGTITLARAAAGQPSPVTATPIPAATRTAVPAQPTATPAPTSVPTAVPGPAIQATLSHKVNPGSRQVIHIHSAPNTIIHVQITFPNGDQRQSTTATDAAGNAKFSFLQHSSRIMHKHLFATVTIQADRNGATSTTVLRYRIGWSKIDLAVEPRQQAVGRQVFIWVHSSPRTPVSVTLHFPAGKTRTLSDRTGAHGWVEIPYKVGRSLKKRNNGRVVVTARATLGGQSYGAKSTFTIT